MSTFVGTAFALGAGELKLQWKGAAMMKANELTCLEHDTAESVLLPEEAACFRSSLHRVQPYSIEERSARRCLISFEGSLFSLGNSEIGRTAEARLGLLLRYKNRTGVYSAVYTEWKQHLLSRESMVTSSVELVRATDSGRLI